MGLLTMILINYCLDIKGDLNNDVIRESVLGINFFRI